MLYIFLIASIIGWIIEGIFTLIIYGNFINHSAVVIGSFDMAYGICACFLTTFLIKFKDSSYHEIFLVGFIGGSIIEYIMSFGMELVLGFTAWDYSNYFLNINGRICLLFSIFWGFLGILWIKVCYPFIMKIISKITIEFRKKLAIIILITLIVDIFITISAVARAHDADLGIDPKNTYEEFLDRTFNSKYLKNMYNNNWK